MPKKKSLPPIDRALLVKLTVGLNEGVVTDTDLDRWAAKLDAEKNRYCKGRIVMEQFLPFMTERVQKSINRMMRLAANPGLN